MIYCFLGGFAVGAAILMLIFWAWVNHEHAAAKKKAEQMDGLIRSKMINAIQEIANSQKQRGVSTVSPRASTELPGTGLGLADEDPIKASHRQEVERFAAWWTGPKQDRQD